MNKVAVFCDRHRSHFCPCVKPHAYEPPEHVNRDGRTNAVLVEAWREWRADDRSDGMTADGAVARRIAEAGWRSAA